MDELEDCMDQVYRMALASMQSYTFWYYTRPDDSPFEKALKTYGHFFYATNEAHLTMMFISLDCLYDEKPKLVNFEKLLSLLPSRLTPEDLDAIQKRVEKLRKEAKAIGIIRNNSFAHIVSHAKREEVGKKYAPSHGELIGLCYHTLDTATQIAKLLGRVVPSAQEVHAKDVETIQALFEEIVEPVTQVAATR